MSNEDNLNVRYFAEVSLAIHGTGKDREDRVELKSLGDSPRVDGQIVTSADFYWMSESRGPDGELEKGRVRKAFEGRRFYSHPAGPDFIREKFPRIAEDILDKMKKNHVNNAVVVGDGTLRVPSYIHQVLAPLETAKPVLTSAGKSHLRDELPRILGSRGCSYNCRG